MSACIDGYPKHGLSVDHFRLNKFSSPNDACYKAVAGEIQRLVREAPYRVALRLESVREGDFSARFAQCSESPYSRKRYTDHEPNNKTQRPFNGTSAQAGVVCDTNQRLHAQSEVSQNLHARKIYLEAPESSQDQDEGTLDAATSSMPRRMQLKPPQLNRNAKKPPASAVQRYRSAQTGRLLPPSTYRTGDKVGLQQDRIASIASPDGSYDPYYVKQVGVSKSDKFTYRIAPALDGVDGGWVEQEELEFYKEPEVKDEGSAELDDLKNSLLQLALGARRGY